MKMTIKEVRLVEYWLGVRFLRAAPLYFSAKISISRAAWLARNPPRAVNVLQPGYVARDSF